MKGLKKDFRYARENFRKAEDRVAKNIMNPLVAEHSRALKLFLVALVAISTAAVCIENGLHPLALLALLPICAALMRRDYNKPYISSETFISCLLLAYVVALVVGILVAQRRLVIPLFMVYFTFGILTARALSPLTDRAIPQLIFLSVGLILINCILTNHLIFGLLLPFYLFVLMGTLMLFLLDKSKRASRDSTYLVHQDLSLPIGLGKLAAKYSGFVFILTIVGFVIIPRPFLIFPGLGAATSAAGGLGDLQKYISYKEIASMADRHRVAFFVHVERGSLPDYPYWRGRVLDRTDGNRWDSTQTRGSIAGLIRAERLETFVYRFVPRRLLSQTIYAAGLPLRVEGRMGRPLYLNSRAEIVLDSPFLLTDSYRIFAVDRPVPAASKIDPVNSSRAGVTSRIERQAQEWTSELTSPAKKAGALERRLRTQFRYVLENPRAPENVPPLEHFLFQSRSGNCEYFAGALCLMLRAVGIPARVVEGFAGAESTDQAGEFLVRFSHAHAWVEAALGDGNWTTFDATPPGPAGTEASLWRFLVDLYDASEFRWNRYVVHFDRSDQALLLNTLPQILMTVMGWLSGIKWKMIWILWALGGGVIIALICFVGIRPFNRTLGPSRIYLQTMHSLKRKKILSRVDSWHENNLAQIIEKLPESKDAAQKFMEIYFSARFDGEGRGSQGVLAAARKELLRTVDRVRKQASQTHGGVR